MTVREAAAFLKEAEALENQNEGWKGSGRCKICRRLSYCKTMCTSCKTRVEAVRRLSIEVARKGKFTEAEA